MLQRLHIENFRGIRSLDMDGLGRVNILLGKNNCGKTSVLEAVFLLACGDKMDSVLSLNKLRLLDTKEKSNLTTLFYGRGTGHPVVIKSELDNSAPCSVRVSVCNAGARQTYEAETDDARKALSSSVPAYDGLDYVFTRAERDYRRRLVYREGKIAGEYLTEERYGFPEAIYLPANIKTIPTMEQLRKAVMEKRTGELVEVLRVFDRRIQGITVVGDEVVVDTGLSILLPVSLMGDGVVKAVQILAAIRETVDGIVLVDEIDNGIHASALPAFWKAVVKFAKQHFVQVFASTHSWESLQSVAKVFGNDPEAQKEIQCFSLIRTSEDDMTHGLKYDFERLQSAVEVELDIR
jgi:hypothetical protein